MINLISPRHQAQLAYSRRNVVVLHYLLFVLVIGAALGTVLFFSLRYADNQLATAQAQLTERETSLAAYATLEEEAAAINNKFKAIEALLDNQARFSALLADIAEVMPSGAYINNLSLTGDSQRPVGLTITVNSYSQAAITRNALMTSERIESADIQSVAETEDGFVAELVIAFSEGGGR